MIPQKAERIHWLGRKKGSPKSLSREARSLIASRAIDERDITREELAESLIKQIEDSGDKAPTLETTIKYISKARNENKDQMDEPWNTAVSNSEDIAPMDAEVVPWIVGVQFNRNRFQSKPLTVREAKWFNRLFGFRPLIRTLPEIENDQEFKFFFISNILGTWAEIYADSEIIDKIIGYRKPDFSEYDQAIFEAISRNNLQSMHKILQRRGGYSDEGIYLMLAKQAKGLLDFKIETPALPSVRYLETLLLFHSLGTPNMSSQSLEMYNFMLLTVRFGNNRTFATNLGKLTYKEKINFFFNLRRWCLNNENTYESVESAVSTFLDNVEKKDGVK